MDKSMAEKKVLFEKIWLLNEEKIRRTCQEQLCEKPEDVEEVMSTAAADLWSEIYLDKQVNNWSARARIIAGNALRRKVTEIKKRERNEISIYSREAELYNANDEYDFISCYISFFLLEKLKLCLNEKLKPAEKELFKYIYEDEMKFKDIAQLLGMSEGAVKQKNFRLRRKMGKSIKTILG